MARYLTAIKLGPGGNSSVDVAEVQWLRSKSGRTGRVSVQQMMMWIAAGNSLYIGSPGGRVRVDLVKESDRMFLRTRVDDLTNDVLLTLPRFE